MTFFLTDTENLWSFPFFETTDDFRLLLIWTYPGYYKPARVPPPRKFLRAFFLFLETITNYKFSLFQPFGFYQGLFHPFFLSFITRNWLIFRKIWNSKLNIALNWPPKGFTPNGDHDALIVYELFLWDILFSYILETRYLIILKLK